MSNSAPAGRRPGMFDFSHLRGDLFGGLTAGVVALPLALAFGEASGAGPIAGVWGAILTGFFAALFGGTNTQVTGPTGPMVVVFAGVFASLSGNPALVFAAVVLAGIIQILFGIFRLGEYIRLVPYPVISGFMTGIGAIIILLQAPRLFGYEPESGGTISAIEAIPGALMDPNLAAAGLGFLTLAIVFFWPSALRKFVPSPLAALVIATAISAFFNMNEQFGVPILGSEITTGLPHFVVPTFSADTAFIILKAAIILAALGMIDSLLTSLVADNMTRTRHNSNRELIGQGIGNAMAGFFGAIPGAGATMRTVVNIKTGGVTRLSGMIHAVVLLSVAVMPFMTPLAQAIPHAVLAGILVKVGLDIVDVAYLKRAHKGPRWDLFLMALVLFITVFVDLITAVGVGVFLAGLGFVKSIADQQLEDIAKGDFDALDAESRSIIEQADGHIRVFEFSGPLSFGAAADLSHRIREVSEGHDVIVLDFHKLPSIDVSAARAVESIVTDATAEGTTVFTAGMTDKVSGVLGALGADQGIPEAHRFPTVHDALKAAKARLATGAEKGAGAETSEASAAPA